MFTLSTPVHSLYDFVEICGVGKLTPVPVNVTSYHSRSVKFPLSCAAVINFNLSLMSLFLSLLQPIFQRYPRPEKECQSFSLIYSDRSLDLVGI